MSNVRHISKGSYVYSWSFHYKEPVRICWGVYCSKGGKDIEVSCKNGMYETSEFRTMYSGHQNFVKKQKRFKKYDDVNWLLERIKGGKLC